MCSKYFQNCLPFILDYGREQAIRSHRLNFVEDIDSCTQWQEQLLLMKQGYHFAKTITLPDGGLLTGAFDPETWNAKPSVALGSTIITMPDKSTVDLGHFDTAEEATQAVKKYLAQQVKAELLTQAEADKILSNAAVE